VIAGNELMKRNEADRERERNQVRDKCGDAEEARLTA
jgi:hypothetical protein